MRISKLRDEETFVVAPDFPPNLRSYFVSDRVSKILRHAEAVGIGRVITRIVHIGDRRQFVPYFPRDGDVIQIAKRAVVIGRLGTDVG